MVEVFHAELDMVRRERSIIEIRPVAPVADARTVIRVVLINIGYFPICALFVAIASQYHPVTVERHGRITEQLIVEHIIPASGNNRVSPVQTAFIIVDAFRIIISIAVVCLFKIETIVVFPVIETEKRAAAVAELMVYFGIEVVEVVVETIAIALEGARKKSGVRAPGR